MAFISQKRYNFALKYSIIINNVMKKDIKTLLSKVESRLVKRIHERPSKDTLDHLALFVGFQSWDSFQRHLHEGEDPVNNEQ